MTACAVEALLNRPGVTGKPVRTDSAESRSLRSCWPAHLSAKVKIMNLNHRMQQLNSTVKEKVQDAGKMANTAVQEQPAALALAAFGMGVGVGVGVVWLFSNSECAQKAERNSLVQQVMDSVTRMLPDAISRHMPT